MVQEVRTDCHVKGLALIAVDQQGSYIMSISNVQQSILMSKGLHLHGSHQEKQPCRINISTVLLIFLTSSLPHHPLARSSTRCRRLQKIMAFLHHHQLSFHTFPDLPSQWCDATAYCQTSGQSTCFLPKDC